MNSFVVKKGIAGILEVCGINSLGLYRLGKRYKNNYIRVVNYHHVEEKDRKNFQKQLQWYGKHFEDVNWDNFEKFMMGEYQYVNKPGLIITFDDGFEDNYSVAFQELNNEGFTGWYMISAGKIGKSGYMSSKQIRRLAEHDSVIGCHTYSHHRMLKNDTQEILNKEIITAKEEMERILQLKIELFCWCGGEEEHYTRKAAEKIMEAGYGYSMMTNSYPLLSSTDHFHIQRSNIEAGWSIALLKFQIAGLMDWKFRKKRERVNRITQGE